MKRFGFLIRYLWVLVLVWLGGMTLFVAPRETRISVRENRMLAAAPKLSFDTVADGSFMTDTETWLSDGIVLREPLIDLSRCVEGLLSLSQDEAEQEQDLIDAIDAEMNETPLPVLSSASAAPTPADTPLATAAAAMTAPAESPAATERPEISDAAFKIIYEDGRAQTVTEFPAANIAAAADVLNTYRALLPEDGSVIFAQVPVSSMGNAFLQQLNRKPVWRSDMEEMLAALVDEGVYVINAPEALSIPLENGEYVYFRTDHHWTARGAHAVYRAAMERLGIPPAAYDDYTYVIKNGMRGNRADSGAKDDTLEVMLELAPVESYVVSHLDQSVEVPFMDLSWNNYYAFLGGTKSPWRRFETGAQTGRTALLIGDSFSNAFLPYLLPHYDRIMMTDLRYASYDPEKAGASVAEYMEAYGVDDVYFVFCYATSINSAMFTGGQIVRYLH